MELLLFAPIAGISALLFSICLAYSVLRQDSGTEKMQDISTAIREGAIAYLGRQNKIVAFFSILISIGLYKLIGTPTAIAFLAGAFSSALASFIGMNIAIRANVRTAQAATKGIDSALNTAFKAGSVTGMSVVGLVLLGVSTLYFIYQDPLVMMGFGFGASLVGLFATVGGGIFTKAADVGADLVGKVEAGIPEDDPRNPAVIADNVGDNVGDCAGMGAGIFESYSVTLIAAMLLGVAAIGLNGAIYPLAIGGIAIFASIIASFTVRGVEKSSVIKVLYRAVFIAGILSAAGFYYLTQELGLAIELYYATLIGLGVAFGINLITEYYTGTGHRPVRMISDASQTGAGTNLIAGLAVGLQSTFMPAILVSIAILASYSLAGIYGVAIAAVAMLSIAGIIFAVDSLGPITDNAGGIAEMAEMPESVRDVTDILDAVGNTTKAVTKGYSMTASVLAAFALFSVYTQQVEIARQAQGITEAFTLNLTDPILLTGLLMGGMLPFVFASSTMQAVGKAAFQVVEEVRRQFKEISGIMERKQKPDYARCVDIVTLAAQKELVIPGIIAASPLIVGFLLGPKALAGLLIGSILTGFLLAVNMTTGGAAWDNAKKYIEAGNLGGKGSDAHKAAVVGDTVGDPFKDTSGPSLSSLIKIMNIMAVIFAALFVKFALF